MPESPALRYLGLPCLALAAIAPPVMANEPSVSDVEDGREIVVIAERYPGAVLAAQPPLVTLDQQDIASYGAGSLAELLEAVAPQAGSGRGRGGDGPVILVNGQRVSNFRELRRYSPEAIARIEILPEEVAQRYGYSADQRVVNFILKDNYSSRETEAEWGLPDGGGYSTGQMELTWLRIRGEDRLNLALDLNRSGLLTEAERGVRQELDSVPLAGDPDPARHRSLIARSKSAELTGGWTTGLGVEGSSFNLNASARLEESHSFSGLDTVRLTDPDGVSVLRSFNASDPLGRRSRTQTYGLGATLVNPLGSWKLTTTLDANHLRKRTMTERGADTSEIEALAAGGVLAIDGPLPVIEPGQQQVARSRTSSIKSMFNLEGHPLSLPAGEVTMTAYGGYEWYRIIGRNSDLATGSTRLTRGNMRGGVNLSVPLTSKRKGAWGAVGDISLNLNGAVEDLSDFGSLITYTTGLTWKPVPDITLQASYIHAEKAPDLSQLGDPVLQGFNVPVYDFDRGVTALVTVTTGGNPLLTRETRRDIKLSASWEPSFLRRSSLTVEYFRNRSSDVTASFPLFTPQVEAAFPDRIVRDAAGALVALDQRPVTLARESASRLRYGIDLSGEIGHAGAGEPDMMAMMRGRSPGQGRWSASLYHTIELDNAVQLASGGPWLDLLNGDAIADTGGVARHKLTAQGGLFMGGIGMRLNADYESATRVLGGPGTTDDLRFGSLATVDLRMFIDLGSQSWIESDPGVTKDLRLMLRIDNIFNARRRVTDADETVPIAYQPDLLDPKGRFFEIELRKIF